MKNDKAKPKILAKMPVECTCGHPLDWAVPRATGKNVLVYNCPICKKGYVLRP